MKITKIIILVAAAFCGMAILALAQNPCDKLKTLSLPDTTVTAVEFVAGRAFPRSRFSTGFTCSCGATRQRPWSGSGRPSAPPGPLPAYCRVALVLTPSKDSHIESEVWLPAEDWNGKLQVVGNGGWAGSIFYTEMASALRERYATAATDTGHKSSGFGGSGTFALGHPEKIVDFGYRAMHETTVKAKAIIKAFYDKGPKYSYYNGCSTGGRQGLVAVTRYPEDYDGVVAGASANPQIHLHAAGVAMNMDLRKDTHEPLTQAKVATLHKAILDACDAMDGVKDGLLADPPKCHFDPATLLCKGADSDSCLTAAQVETVKRVFADTKTRKGEIIWTGYSLGSELQIISLTAKINPDAPPGGMALDSIRILGYQDPNWDWRTWDLDRDVALADEQAGYIDARTSDLSAYKAHGGKLLLYHGWCRSGHSSWKHREFLQRSALENGTKAG